MPNDNERAEREAELESLKRIAENLGEEWDTVQIFVTRYDSGGAGGTIHMSHGVGNWMARKGQIDSWVTYQDAILCEEATAESEQE
jgi:hypothetical protein